MFKEKVIENKRKKDLEKKQREDALLVRNKFLAEWASNILGLNEHKKIKYINKLSKFTKEKNKFIIKKITLTNFFIISIISWYSQINNFSLKEVIPFYILKFGNINFLNIVFLLAIEIMFYLWSYISYNTYLSDWKVPKPYAKEAKPIIYILLFYLLIILYYSILFK